MDQDTTLWNREREDIVSGISWAKKTIPRVVVQMDVITYRFFWPRDMAKCPNYDPKDIDLQASALNQISVVRQKQGRKSQRRARLWAVGTLIGAAFSPRPMLPHEHMDEYSMNASLNEVAYQRRR